MSSITKQINGVVATITPAVLQSLGPDRQQIEFTSQTGKAASLPMTILFDIPVNRFSFDVVGLTFPGHITRVYNKFGQEITTLRTDTTAIDSAIGGTARAGGIERVTYTNDLTPISKLEITPPATDYIGYRNLSMNAFPGYQSTTPPTTTQIDPTPPITPTESEEPITHDPSRRYVNLADVVVMDVITINRQYTKNTMLAIPPATFNIQNTSSELEVQVSLLGLAGVTFNPQNFSLAQNEIREIVVNFDPVLINDLPEGVNTVHAVANLTSTTAVI